MRRPNHNHRHARRHACGIAAAAVLVVAACGGDEPGAAAPVTTGAPVAITSAAAEPVAEPATLTPTTAAAPADRIPDGTYRRIATVADADARGLDRELTREMAGPDGEMPMAIEVDGDRFRLLVTNDADIEEVGTAGAYRYAEPGTWILEEDCCGDIPLSWTLSDGVLALQLPDGAPDEGIFVFEGDWVLDTGDGGAIAELTLTFANSLNDLPSQLLPFAVEVRERSDERIGFEPAFEAGTEQEVLDRLLAGFADIAWVGARAMPEFDALLAPFLVDSYELQDAVFEAGLVDRMADRAAERGFTVLAVYPGPMRKMVGVDAALLGPADYAGKVIAVPTTPLTELTMEVLGATARPSAGGMDVTVLDGFDFQLAAVFGNDYQSQVAAVTANANIWPRPLVLLMTTERFASLTAEQQAVLTGAAASTFDEAAAATIAEDVDVTPAMCSSPMQAVQATPDDLAALRLAVTPVHDWIAEDPFDAGLLAEIEAIKAQVAAPPSTVTCD